MDQRLGSARCAPRRRRRRLSSAVALAATSIVGVQAIPVDVSAAGTTIRVTTTSDTPSASQCTFRDAIIAANTNTASNGCLAGSAIEPDTIVFGNIGSACTAEPPEASSLNYNVGTTRPNEVIAKLSPTGTLCVFTLTTTHLIIDITGHNGT